MKPTREPKGCRPFADLKARLQLKAPASAKAKPAAASGPPQLDHGSPPLPDGSEFLAAVADITPLHSNKVTILPTGPTGLMVKAADHQEDENRQTSFEKIILEGEDVTITNIPEYLEGRGCHPDPNISKRLHRGDFSIQDHLDLHGLNRQEAKEALDGFLNEAVRTGKRMVLVIHGRGLSSPFKPVLKLKVREWLTTGIWRQWILAFSSARAIDGGTGATYVLLRKNPSHSA